MSQPLTIGVLALQGAYEAHAAMLRQLGATAILVRKPEQLANLDGLIIPGGESTTFLKHLERAGFFDALSDFVKQKPTFGTCAGAILLAKDVANPPQRSLAAMDMTVERNFYGRQNDSVILNSETTLPGDPLEMVYIRAPRIAHVGPGIETIARRGDDPALVRQGHLLAATFHPELGHDLRIHQLFLDMVAKAKLERTPA
jgi:5'-phosphate synthase pdxT subunit